MKLGFTQLLHFTCTSPLLYRKDCTVLSFGILSPRQEEIFERAHRFCIKFIQVLPKQTRTDIALSLLGSYTVVAEIDKRN